jgi:polyisoprenoid-binding protein YceI
MQRSTHRSLIGAAIGAALLGGFAIAHANPETLQLTAGNMLAQTRSSAILFNVTGTYRQLSGTLDFDPTAKTCAIDVTFQTRSLALPNAIVRARVMSKSFLDPDKYPTTRFKGACADNGAKLVGQLTMHGQTHPFTMDLTDQMQGNRLVGFYTKGKLDRYHWGLDGQQMTVGKTITVLNDISLNGKPPKMPH